MPVYYPQGSECRPDSSSKVKVGSGNLYFGPNDLIFLKCSKLNMKAWQSLSSGILPGTLIQHFV